MRAAASHLQRNASLPGACLFLNGVWRGPSAQILHKARVGIGRRRKVIGQQLRVDVSSDLYLLPVGQLAYGKQTGQQQGQWHQARQPRRQTKT